MDEVECGGGGNVAKDLQVILPVIKYLASEYEYRGNLNTKEVAILYRY